MKTPDHREAEIKTQIVRSLCEQLMEQIANAPVQTTHTAIKHMTLDSLQMILDQSVQREPSSDAYMIGALDACIAMVAFGEKWAQNIEAAELDKPPVRDML